jgi:hypothetical protein
MAVTTDAIAPDTSTPTQVATFTKWLVGEGPAMAGVVGGAVGEGTYAGKILEYRPGDVTIVEALYGFEGSERSFTALVHVEQTGLQATISGVVTEGWGKGRPVSGSFDEIKCDHDGITTDFWQGSVEVAGDASA